MKKYIKVGLIILLLIGLPIGGYSLTFHLVYRTYLSRDYQMNEVISHLNLNEKVNRMDDIMMKKNDDIYVSLVIETVFNPGEIERSNVFIDLDYNSTTTYFKYRDGEMNLDCFDKQEKRTGTFEDFMEQIMIFKPDYSLANYRSSMREISLDKYSNTVDVHFDFPEDYEVDFSLPYVGFTLKITDLHCYYQYYMPYARGKDSFSDYRPYLFVIYNYSGKSGDDEIDIAYGKWLRNKGRLIAEDEQ